MFAAVVSICFVDDDDDDDDDVRPASKPPQEEPRAPSVFYVTRKGSYYLQLFEPTKPHSNTNFDVSGSSLKLADSYFNAPYEAAFRERPSDERALPLRYTSSRVSQVYLLAQIGRSIQHRYVHPQLHLAVVNPHVCNQLSSPFQWCIK
eukprot:1546444-Amphidinium_carterae.1